MCMYDIVELHFSLDLKEMLNYSNSPPSSPHCLISRCLPSSKLLISQDHYLKHKWDSGTTVPSHWSCCTSSNTLSCLLLPNLQALGSLCLEKVQGFIPMSLSWGAFSAPHIRRGTLHILPQLSPALPQHQYNHLRHCCVYQHSALVRSACCRACVLVNYLLNE